ncbi:hypothetical protein [Deinococcus soli (ex Cha et al. 2016)]|uniref:Uncharacterized protein n=2 Tax=Deinococcus soli (ex Cha et al. 2016) TaxID=1309411 RepID=A0ACC6KK49_9DEIO|nr:hypothetical protein [Deinococcus soli (ex Cha et al. 2016)]MDR6218566.1 hypothetical protein [Deinococcus soli (ex Cha et al. 2016)]MDR6328363.1 hypothetical protein [Deinococcus soli (ex Cha et al. 2016)]MDR6752974.1 hypothetical protein [Deinococcus soli (ex Cha et al. 2016)]
MVQIESCPPPGQVRRVAVPADLYGPVGPCDDERIEAHISQARDDGFDGVQLDFRLTCTVDELVLASLPGRLESYGEVQATPGAPSLTLLFKERA